MRFDITQIDHLKDDGYIGTQRHPTLPLLIHNYTQRCQFDQAWCELTTMCRGLITDEHGNVIARPFRKFFNLEEHEREGSKLPPINWNQPFYVSEKMDGSLGILYPNDSGYSIATRGSFVSDQSTVATAIWRERYSHFRPKHGKTYLFEIVYPGNRIVVDYGDTRDLILLDVIDIEGGHGAARSDIEAEAMAIGCPVVNHVAVSDAAAIRTYETGDVNREGIVIRFEDGMRIKIKLAEYKRLHRLLTGINARKVWECLSTGTEMDLERVPDEFFDWVAKTREDLREQHHRLLLRVGQEFCDVVNAIGRDAPRKEFAMRFTQSRDISGMLFSMLDGKDITAQAWDAIYPDHTPPWKQDN